MHRHARVQRRDFQLAKHKLVNKLRRLIQPQVRHRLAHTVQTRTLVAEDRPTPVLTRTAQCRLQFARLAHRLVGHTLALPNGAAAEVLHIFGENHLKSCLVQHLGHIVDERCLAAAQTLVEARRKIDYPLVCQPFQPVHHAVFTRSLDGSFAHRTWQRGRPQREVLAAAVV